MDALRYLKLFNYRQNLSTSGSLVTRPSSTTTVTTTTTTTTTKVIDPQFLSLIDNMRKENMAALDNLLITPATERTRRRVTNLILVG
jgi:hypothetical protein